MIPSRGMRGSIRTIALGRRRLESLSARSFSSSTLQNGTVRPSPLLSQRNGSLSKGSCRPQIPRISRNLQAAGSARFKSSASFPSTPTPSADALNASVSNPELAAAAPSSFDSAIDFSSSSLLDIPEHIGYLKSLGLEFGWGPTACVEWLLEHVHVFAGTPWWASITLTTIIMRVLMLKPYMAAADNAARMSAAMPVTKPMTEKMSALTRQGDTQGAMALRAEIQRIHRRAGVVTWKSFTPGLQMFAGYGSFVLLRAMSHLPVPGLETGGILWFQNLAVPDPYFLLPLGTAGILHYVLRKGGEVGVNTMTPGVMKAFAYGLPAVTLLFTSWLPSSLQLSFFVSGILSFLQSELFRNPAFRARFGMHPLPTKRVDPFGKPEEPSPYQERIIVVPKSGYRDQSTAEPTYEAPRSSSSEAAPKKTVLSGLKKEFTDAVQSGKKAAQDTLESGRSVLTPKTKEGEKTKAELRAAAKYEDERRAEEKRKILEADEAKRQARLEKRSRRSKKDEI